MDRRKIDLSMKRRLASKDQSSPRFPWRNPFKGETKNYQAKMGVKGLGLFFGTKIKF